jgi:antitoxin YefM
MYIRPGISYIGIPMNVSSITYTSARRNLSTLMDKVEADRSVVVVTRRGHANVALISEEELAGLEETAYLLRSPANAKRLAEAISDAEAGRVIETTIEELMK